MKFIWYNIILGFLLNWLISPFAILFQKQANKRKGFLWMFLSDNKDKLNEMKVIWYNIIICVIINMIMFPIAFSFRSWARKRNWFLQTLLWWFLHDGNDYGDATYRPNMKPGFWKAYLWALRNPLHNYYYRNRIEGKETDFSGYGKVKFGTNIRSWRTFVCSDTRDNMGKVIDWKGSKFGKQNITFKRISKTGTQKCYRKSACYPFRFMWWIVIFRSRSGHEQGLMQRQFNFEFFSLKNNLFGYRQWKKLQYIKIQIKSNI